MVLGNASKHWTRHKLKTPGERLPNEASYTQGQMAPVHTFVDLASILPEGPDWYFTFK